MAQVTRWTRYGHDRLYVEADVGRLGYWDIKTATPHLESSAHAGLFYAALTEHGVEVPMEYRLASAELWPAASTNLAVTAVGARVTVLPTHDVPEPDLTGNRPGQGPRERAIAERQAAPVKTLVARVMGVHTDERAWRIGAKGEEAVAARLARLGPDWRVLHSITVSESGTDIDHLVIGPGGVFTVNAKHHPTASVWVGGDTFIVSGQRVPYIRAARSEARKASRLLTAAVGQSVPVTGIIAVMGATKGFTIKEQPRDGSVVVVARKDIDGWLSRQLHCLDAAGMERMYQAARRPRTWALG